jgi:hypothetical protein
MRVKAKVVKKKNIIDSTFSNMHMALNNICTHENLSLQGVILKMMQLINLHNRFIYSINDLLTQDELFNFLSVSEKTDIVFWIKNNKIDFIKKIPKLTTYYESFFQYLRECNQITNAQIISELQNAPSIVYYNQDNKLKYYFNDLMIKYVKTEQNSVKSADELINVPFLTINKNTSDEMFFNTIMQEMSMETRKDILDEMVALERDPFYTEFIMIYNFLVQYNYHFTLTDIKNIKNHCFIEALGEKNFKSMCSISTVDFKDILESNLPKKEQIRNAVFTFNYVMFEMTSELYQIISSPNFDIDSVMAFCFSRMDSMSEQLPRCRELFSFMRKKIGMFKSKFPNYYREQVETDSSFNIITAFVNDILTEENKEKKPEKAGSTSKLVFQFKILQRHIMKELLNARSNGQSIPDFNQQGGEKQSSDKVQEYLRANKKKQEEIEMILSMCSDINKTINKDYKNDEDFNEMVREAGELCESDDEEDEEEEDENEDELESESEGEEDESENESESEGEVEVNEDNEENEEDESESDDDFGLM